MKSASLPSVVRNTRPLSATPKPRLFLAALCVVFSSAGVCDAQQSDRLEHIRSVSIGANREFLVNDKPFLPIFGWLQKPATLPTLKSLGFNTIAGCWRNPDGTGHLKSADAYGEAAWKEQMYFIATFDAKFPQEMERLKGTPHLLSWFHGDEPDLIKKTSDAVISSNKLIINTSRPLQFLTDGDPKTSAVLSPVSGAEVTIRYPKPATVGTLLLGNGPDGTKAREIAVLANGKEICRGDLPNTVEMKKFTLESPQTFQELTLKIIALHEPPAEQTASNWGTISGIDGLDQGGVNVLKCELRKELQQNPEETRKAYDEIKRFDSSRPVFLTFSSFFLEALYDKSWYTRAEASALYPRYVGSADVYGIDIYPIYGWNQPQNLRWVADATRQQRALVGPDEPLFQWIETSPGGFGDKSKPVTGLEIRNEVYQALASGCTAIGYFTHVFKPTFNSFGVPPENQEAIKKINAELAALAPSLLGPDSKEQPTLTLTGNLLSLCHAKTTDRTMTVIAINMDGTNHGGRGTVTLPGLPADTDIVVSGEDRTIKAESGQWTDDFGPLAVHIYSLPAPPNSDTRLRH